MSDTPDTRTPSAEGCGHVRHDDEDTSYLTGRPTFTRHGLTRDGAWIVCPLPGQGSDAPSAPNRAPTDEARCTCLNVMPGDEFTTDYACPAHAAPTEGTAGRDALVERIARALDEAEGSFLGWEGYTRWAEAAADALEDLTRENERLRAELAEVREAFQGGVHQERDGVGLNPCICGNDWPCPRWCEPSPEDYADVAAAAGRLEAERDDLRRQVAAVRVLPDLGDEYDGERLPLLYTAAQVRAALDTASDRARTATHDETGREDLMGGASGEPRGIRPEDGYGTDNVPGGWGGPGSQETRDA